MDLSVTYLLNSGFIVELGRTLLVFDDFEDQQDLVGQAIRAGKHEAMRIS